MSLLLLSKIILEVRRPKSMSRPLVLDGDPEGFCTPASTLVEDLLPLRRVTSRHD